ncbi:MAG TPA: adenylate/guanylate cyclase domain-containing protein [Acidimicrobiales bacterium]|nr:adenylate/guanylate cyclase domain-containing protein [Acidimicrobiales bacterium]
MTDDLAAGRKAYAEHRWADAYAHLSAADRSAALEPADLEQLAEAARWSRHFDELLDLLEQAETAYAANGDKRGAARLALALAREHYQRRDQAVASGWLGRASTLLGDDTDCAEYGLLSWMMGRAMWDTGNHQACRDLFIQVVEMGRRLDAPDLEGLGLLEQGHGLIVEGRATEGLAMIDEANALAATGGLTLTAAGTIYCSTIFACRNLGDWQRAGEWTDAATRWCERQSVSGFPGLCRFHRAEVRRLRGALDDAERDALDACEELMASAPRTAAWAFHEVGEIRRRRGDLPAATEAFRRASELGFDPQPGLALLRLDEGQADVALQSISNALADESGFVQEQRAFLLPAQVTIAVAAGALEVADGAASALTTLAEACATSALAASAAGARGEVALAEGRVDEAIPELRQCVGRWAELDAPYEAAQAKVQLARAYEAAGRNDDSTMELESARAAFERIGATKAAADISHRLAASAPAARPVRTFMFTDIVGSTKLVEALGDEAWDALLTWHDRTLRAAFEQFAGVEIKHEGDGFFVAFDDTAGAVEAACAIQRRLADHRREHGFAVQVRIGLHTAEATERQGDYGGKGVHETARIAAAAGPGEIVASQAALDAAGGRHAVDDERSISLRGLSVPLTVASVRW